MKTSKRHLEHAQKHRAERIGTRQRQGGFTLIEVLVALGVVGISFGIILFTQVGNMRVNAQTRTSSLMKAEATRVLERKTADVLSYTGTINVNAVYKFQDYYWNCPTVSTSSNRPVFTSTITPSDCSGTDGNSAWSIAGEGGISGEGLMTITVTTRSADGRTYTLGNRISCYDIDPSPTNDTPGVCPANPTAAGGGR